MTTTYTIQTEEQIERKVEVAMNRLDDALMSGRIDQAAYDHRVAKLDRWADQEYSLIRRDRERANFLKRLPRAFNGMCNETADDHRQSA